MDRKTSHHDYSRHACIAVFATVVLATQSGCGSAPASVVGQVTFEGEAIPEGMIRFTPIAPTEGPGAAVAISEGSYEVSEEDGLVEGNYYVAVMATRKTGRQTRAVEAGFDASGRGPGEVGSQSGSVEQIQQYIPGRYNSQTQLTIELAAGDNQHDLQLSQ